MLALSESADAGEKLLQGLLPGAPSGKQAAGAVGEEGGVVKVYVASSWRNMFQQAVVVILRQHGHDVYDFRNPSPGDHGFGWRQCAENGDLEDPVRFRDRVLTHPIAKAAFEKDMGALRAAEATVLVLPCGRSAHLELGWATGAGQKTVVLLDNPMSEPELMYLMNTRICTSLVEVVGALRGV